MTDFQKGDKVRVNLNLNLDTTVRYVNSDGSVDIRCPQGDQNDRFDSILCVSPQFVTRQNPDPVPGDIWETPDGTRYAALRRPEHGTRFVVADSGIHYAQWYTVAEFFRREPGARRVFSGKES